MAAVATVEVPLVALEQEAANTLMEEQKIHDQGYLVQ
jgi:hypothetical protein